MAAKKTASWNHVVGAGALLIVPSSRVRCGAVRDRRVNVGWVPSSRHFLLRSGKGLPLPCIRDDRGTCIRRGTALSSALGLWWLAGACPTFRVWAASKPSRRGVPYSRHQRKSPPRFAFSLSSWSRSRKWMPTASYADQVDCQVLGACSSSAPLLVRTGRIGGRGVPHQLRCGGASGQRESGREVVPERRRHRCAHAVCLIGASIFGCP